MQDGGKKVGTLANIKDEKHLQGFGKDHGDIISEIFKEIFAKRET